MKIIKTSIETIREAMKNSTDHNIVEIEHQLTDQQIAILKGLYRLSYESNQESKQP